MSYGPLINNARICFLYNWLKDIIRNVGLEYCVIPTFLSDQEVIHTQDQSITELLKAVREQSDQLNLQKLKIKTLEEKVNVRKVSVVGQEEGIFLFIGENLSPCIYIMSVIVSFILKTSRRYTTVLIRHWMLFGSRSVQLECRVIEWMVTPPPPFLQSLFSDFTICPDFDLWAVVIMTLLWIRQYGHFIGVMMFYPYFKSTWLVSQW